MEAYVAASCDVQVQQQEAETHARAEASGLPAGTDSQSCNTTAPTTARRLHPVPSAAQLKCMLPPDPLIPIQAMTANIADPDAPTAAGLPLVEGQSSQGWVMSLAVPGLTVPWTHSIYLWVATAISIGVHEVGTAGGA